MGIKIYEPKPVKPRHVVSHSYDMKKSELTVKYRSGVSYRYSGISAGQYASFGRNESKGGWLRTHVIGNPAHPHQRLDDPNPGEDITLGDGRPARIVGKSHPDPLPFSELDAAARKRGL